MGEFMWWKTDRRGRLLQKVVEEVDESAYYIVDENGEPLEDENRLYLRWA